MILLGNTAVDVSVKTLASSFVIALRLLTLRPAETDLVLFIFVPTLIFFLIVISTTGVVGTGQEVA